MHRICKSGKTNRLVTPNSTLKKIKKWPLFFFFQFHHHSHHYNRSYLYEKCTTAAFHKEKRTQVPQRTPALLSLLAFLSTTLAEKNWIFSITTTRRPRSNDSNCTSFFAPFLCTDHLKLTSGCFKWGLFKSLTEHDMKLAYDLVPLSPLRPYSFYAPCNR